MKDESTTTSQDLEGIATSIPTNAMTARIYGANLAPWQENNAKILGFYGGVLNLERPDVYIFSRESSIPHWVRDERVILAPEVLSKKFEDAVFDYLRMYSLSKYLSLTTDGLPNEIVKKLIQATVPYSGSIKSFSKSWQRAPPQNQKP